MKQDPLQLSDAKEDLLGESTVGRQEISEEAEQNNLDAYDGADGSRDQGLDVAGWPLGGDEVVDKSEGQERSH